jgi:hypothetical protein
MSGDQIKLEPWSVNGLLEVVDGKIRTEDLNKDRKLEEIMI